MKYLIIAFLTLHSLIVCGQQKPTDLDKSPMDVSYFPANYPILKMNGKMSTMPIARVLYSRPQCAGRKIFGETVVYNQVWRLGANEATEFECFRNLKFGQKSILKGRYSIFAICNEKEWTIIFNSEKDIWGLSYNEKKDVARITVPVTTTTEITEAFTMYFENKSDGAQLIIMWDNAKVSIPFSF